MIFFPVPQILFLHPCTKAMIHKQINIIIAIILNRNIIVFFLYLFFLNLIDKRDAATLTDEADPYTTTNGATLARLMIDSANPETPALSATEILDYVPQEDGISISDAKSLINTTDVRKTSIFKNTEAALKSQFGYEGIMSGFGSKQLGALYYNNAMSEILEALTEEPLKGTDLRDQMNSIAGPYLEQYMLEYGESQDTIDKKLSLMGIKTSPAKTITAPKAVLRWIPGKGWK